MPRRAEPEHAGGVTARTALLLVDVIHAFDFEPDDEAARLHERARTMLPVVARLRRRARQHRVPVVYVNDNFGRWRSSFEATTQRAIASRRGDVARRLAPARDDWFVLKPSRSGFHHSPLEALLESFGARTVIIAGITSDMCVLATASDAVMRKLRCHVPTDASVAVDDARHASALALLRDAMGADVRPTAELPWARLARPR